MTRPIWFALTLTAYVLTVALIWNYEPATAAGKTTQIDTTEITMQSPLLPAISFDMF
jgi:hypothetical protein